MECFLFHCLAFMFMCFLALLLKVLLLRDSNEFPLGFNKIWLHFFSLRRLTEVKPHMGPCKSVWWINQLVEALSLTVMDIFNKLMRAKVDILKFRLFF